MVNKAIRDQTIMKILLDFTLKEPSLLVNLKGPLVDIAVVKFMDVKCLVLHSCISTVVRELHITRPMLLYASSRWLSLYAQFYGDIVLYSGAHLSMFTSRKS